MRPHSYQFDLYLNKYFTLGGVVLALFVGVVVMAFKQDAAEKEARREDHRVFMEQAHEITQRLRHSQERYCLILKQYPAEVARAKEDLGYAGMNSELEKRCPEILTYRNEPAP